MRAPGEVGYSRGRAVVAMLFLFMLINWGDKTVIGLSTVPIIHELHLPHTQFGSIGSSFFLLFPISGTVICFLVNRVHVKPVLVSYHRYLASLSEGTGPLPATS